MCSGVQVTSYCTFLEVRQYLWLWTSPLLAAMKSFAQREFRWHDRIPRTHLISPNRPKGLPSNATANRIRYLVLYEIYGKISFYSLRTLYPDKERYCALLGISLYFGFFFLNQGLCCSGYIIHVETDTCRLYPRWIPPNSMMLSYMK